MPFRIEIHQDFNKPVSEVFGDLGDHEKLGRILGAPITRIVDGRGVGGKNGLGAVRRIGPALGGFEETIVGFEQDALIEYTITKGSPLRDHLGRMKFSATPNGTHLDYVITFDVKVPFVGGLLKNVLEGSIRKGLAKYARG